MAIAVEMLFAMECVGEVKLWSGSVIVPEVRAHVEDYKVVRSVVPDSSERCMLRVGDRGVVLWVQSVFVRSMMREVGLVVVFGPSRVGIVVVGSYGHLGVCGVH